jgi:hypothetical protein
MILSIGETQSDTLALSTLTVDGSPVVNIGQKKLSPDSSCKACFKLQTNVTPESHPGSSLSSALLGV